MGVNLKTGEMHQIFIYSGHIFVKIIENDIIALSPVRTRVWKGATNALKTKPLIKNNQSLKELMRLSLWQACHHLHTWSFLCRHSCANISQ